MTDFTAHVPVDFSDSLSYFIAGPSSVLIASSNFIRVQDPSGGYQEYVGNFSYTFSGGLQILSWPSSFLANITTYSSSFALEVHASGVNVPGSTYQFFADNNDGEGFKAFLFRGSDSIVGSGSNDVLWGYAGNDSIGGGSGNDTLDGGAGNDVLTGLDGNDTFIVDTTGDRINESTGTDTVQSYIWWVLGNDLENLTLLGSASYGVGNALNNVIIGNGTSNPLLRGEAGADTISGGDGNDWIEGEMGNDAFVGVAGNDVLHGDAGDDTLLAGAGNDALYGDSGTDFLIGEAGDDLAYGGSEWDAIDGRQGSDVLYGEGGDDIIFGDGLFNIFGFSNDSLFGGPGNDTMMGEAGETSASGGGDAIYGEDGNDLLDGGAGDDAIYGGAGVDVIDGDHGNDYIVGGQGTDIILGSNAVAYGGPTQGSDLFVYEMMTDAGDSIYGFDIRPGENDGIDLRPLFDLLGYAGTTPRAAGTNLLQVVQSSGDTLVQIDPDGAPGAQGFTTLLTLVGVTAGTITDSVFLFQ